MTQQQKTAHILAVQRALTALMQAAAQLRDVNTASDQLGYKSGDANALTDADFAAAGGVSTAADYNAALATATALEAQCNAAGANSGPSVWQTFRPWVR